MLNLQFYNPTRIIFGPGSVSKAGDSVRSLGKTVLVLTGHEHAKRNGTLDKVMKSLHSSEINAYVIDGVGPNPRLQRIIEIADEVRSRLPHCIVALGGGSVMDAAKLVSLTLTHDGNPWEYRVTGAKSVPSIKDCLIPVVTIPTTAGTGSEISPAALANHENRKEVFFSPYMYPKVTIIDPELTLTLPKALTAQIAMDAFVQSLEAYVSVNAQPFSDMFAIKSMQLVYSALPKLVRDLGNTSLRCEMSLAGTLSCYAIGQAGVGAVHALSDPLSGRYDIGHGLAVSILLPSVMRANLDANPGKFASLANILLGLDTKDMGQEEASRRSIVLVEDLLEKVGLSGHRLSDYGVSESELAIFADEAENPDMSTNPKKLSKEDRINIYRAVL